MKQASSPRSEFASVSSGLERERIKIEINKGRCQRLGHADIIHDPQRNIGIMKFLLGVVGGLQQRRRQIQHGEHCDADRLLCVQQREA